MTENTISEMQQHLDRLDSEFRRLESLRLELQQRKTGEAFIYF